jgi:hypothetical protein
MSLCSIAGGKKNTHNNIVLAWTTLYSVHYDGQQRILRHVFLADLNLFDIFRVFGKTQLQTSKQETVHTSFRASDGLGGLLKNCSMSNNVLPYEIEIEQYDGPLAPSPSLIHSTIDSLLESLPAR